MELYTFALIVATLEITVGIPLLFNQRAITTVVQKLYQDDVLLKIFGAVYVIVGVLVLHSNWTIDFTVAGIVRLLAWAMLIKGVVLVYRTDHLKKMGQSIIGNSSLMYGAAIFALGIGCWLLSVLPALSS